MHANRVRNLQPPSASAPPPQTALPAIPPGFALCPPQLMVAQSWQQEIYRLAYEQAKAATQVPRHHRMLFSVWN